MRLGKAFIYLCVALAVALPTSSNASTKQADQAKLELGLKLLENWQIEDAYEIASW